MMEIKSDIIDKFSKERVLRLKFKTEVPSEVVQIWYAYFRK
jgi:hypothetical protein